MLREETQTVSVPAAGRRAGRPPLLKRRKFLIGSLVVALAIGFLIYQGIASTGMYYLSVRELRAMGEAAATQQVRLGGRVAEDSVQWEPQNMTLRFVLEDMDGADRMPVLYRGVVPDTFKPGAEVVLEGKSAADVFEAKALLTKCASKYLPLAG